MKTNFYKFILVFYLLFLSSCKLDLKVAKSFSKTQRMNPAISPLRKLQISRNVELSLIHGSEKTVGSEFPIQFIQFQVQIPTGEDLATASKVDLVFDVDEDKAATQQKMTFQGLKVSDGKVDVKHSYDETEIGTFFKGDSAEYSLTLCQSGGSTCYQYKNTIKLWTKKSDSSFSLDSLYFSEITKATYAKSPKNTPFISNSSSFTYYQIIKMKGGNAAVNDGESPVKLIDGKIKVDERQYLYKKIILVFYDSNGLLTQISDSYLVVNEEGIQASMSLNWFHADPQRTHSFELKLYSATSSEYIQAVENIKFTKMNNQAEVLNLDLSSPNVKNGEMIKYDNVQKIFSSSEIGTYYLTFDLAGQPIRFSANFIHVFPEFRDTTGEKGSLYDKNELKDLSCNYYKSKQHMTAIQLLDYIKYPALKILIKQDPNVPNAVFQNTQNRFYLSDTTRLSLTPGTATLTFQDGINAEDYLYKEQIGLTDLVLDDDDHDIYTNELWIKDVSCNACQINFNFLCTSENCNGNVIYPNNCEYSEEEQRIHLTWPIPYDGGEYSLRADDIEFDTATFYLKAQADFKIHLPENVEVGTGKNNKVYAEFVNDEIRDSVTQIRIEKKGETVMRRYFPDSTPLVSYSFGKENPHPTDSTHHKEIYVDLPLATDDEFYKLKYFYLKNYKYVDIEEVRPNMLIRYFEIQDDYHLVQHKLQDIKLIFKSKEIFNKFKDSSVYYKFRMPHQFREYENEGQATCFYDNNSQIAICQFNTININDASYLIFGIREKLPSSSSALNELYYSSQLTYLVIPQINDEDQCRINDHTKTNNPATVKVYVPENIPVNLYLGTNENNAFDVGVLQSSNQALIKIFYIDLDKLEEEIVYNYYILLGKGTPGEKLVLVEDKTFKLEHSFKFISIEPQTLYLPDMQNILTLTVDSSDPKQKINRIPDLYIYTEDMSQLIFTLIGANANKTDYSITYKANMSSIANTTKRGKYFIFYRSDCGYPVASQIGIQLEYNYLIQMNQTYIAREKMSSTIIQLDYKYIFGVRQPQKIFGKMMGTSTIIKLSSEIIYYDRNYLGIKVTGFEKEGFYTIFTVYDDGEEIRENKWSNNEEVNRGKDHRILAYEHELEFDPEFRYFFNGTKFDEITLPLRYYIIPELLIGMKFKDLDGTEITIKEENYKLSEDGLSITISGFLFDLYKIGYAYVIANEYSDTVYGNMARQKLFLMNVRDQNTLCDAHFQFTFPIPAILGDNIITINSTDYNVKRICKATFKKEDIIDYTEEKVHFCASSLIGQDPTCDPNIQILFKYIDLYYKGYITIPYAAYDKYRTKYTLLSFEECDSMEVCDKESEQVILQDLRLFRDLFEYTDGKTSVTTTIDVFSKEERDKVKREIGCFTSQTRDCSATCTEVASTQGQLTCTFTFPPIYTPTAIVIQPSASSVSYPLLHIIDLITKEEDDKCQMVNDIKDVHMIIRTEKNLPGLGFKISNYNDTTSPFIRIYPTIESWRSGGNFSGSIEFIISADDLQKQEFELKKTNYNFYLEIFKGFEENNVQFTKNGKEVIILDMYVKRIDVDQLVTQLETDGKMTTFYSQNVDAEELVDNYLSLNDDSNFIGIQEEIPLKLDMASLGRVQYSSNLREVYHYGRYYFYYKTKYCNRIFGAEEFPVRVDKPNLIVDDISKEGENSCDIYPLNHKIEVEDSKFTINLHYYIYRNELPETIQLLTSSSNMLVQVYPEYELEKNDPKKKDFAKIIKFTLAKDDPMKLGLAYVNLIFPEYLGYSNYIYGSESILIYQNELKFKEPEEMKWACLIAPNVFYFYLPIRPEQINKVFIQWYKNGAYEAPIELSTSEYSVTSHTITIKTLMDRKLENTFKLIIQTVFCTTTGLNYEDHIVIARECNFEEPIFDIPIPACDGGDVKVKMTFPSYYIYNIDKVYYQSVKNGGELLSITKDKFKDYDEENSSLSFSIFLPKGEAYKIVKVEGENKNITMQEEYILAGYQINDKFMIYDPDTDGKVDLEFIFFNEKHAQKASSLIKVNNIVLPFCEAQDKKVICEDYYIGGSISGNKMIKSNTKLSDPMTLSISIGTGCINEIEVLLLTPGENNLMCQHYNEELTSIKYIVRGNAYFSDIKIEYIQNDGIREGGTLLGVYSVNTKSQTFTLELNSMNIREYRFFKFYLVKGDDKKEIKNSLVKVIGTVEVSGAGIELFYTSKRGIEDSITVNLYQILETEELGGVRFILSDKPYGSDENMTFKTPFDIDEKDCKMGAAGYQDIKETYVCTYTFPENNQCGKYYVQVRDACGRYSKINTNILVHFECPYNVLKSLAPNKIKRSLFSTSLDLGYFQFFTDRAKPTSLTLIRPDGTTSNNKLNIVSFSASTGSDDKVLTATFSGNELGLFNIKSNFPDNYNDLSYIKLLVYDYEMITTSAFERREVGSKINEVTISFKYAFIDEQVNEVFYMIDGEKVPCTWESMENGKKLKVIFPSEITFDKEIDIYIDDLGAATNVKYQVLFKDDGEIKLENELIFVDPKSASSATLKFQINFTSKALMNKNMKNIILLPCLDGSCVEKKLNCNEDINANSNSIICQYSSYKYNGPIKMQIKLGDSSSSDSEPFKKDVYVCTGTFSDKPFTSSYAMETLFDIECLVPLDFYSNGNKLNEIVEENNDDFYSYKMNFKEGGEKYFKEEGTYELTVGLRINPTTTTTKIKSIQRHDEKQILSIPETLYAGNEKAQSFTVEFNKNIEEEEAKFIIFKSSILDAEYKTTECSVISNKLKCVIDLSEAKLGDYSIYYSPTEYSLDYINAQYTKYLTSSVQIETITPGVIDRTVETEVTFTFNKKVDFDNLNSIVPKSIENGDVYSSVKLTCVKVDEKDNECKATIPANLLKEGNYNFLMQFKDNNDNYESDKNKTLRVIENIGFTTNTKIIIKNSYTGNIDIKIKAETIPESLNNQINSVQICGVKFNRASNSNEYSYSGKEISNCKDYLAYFTINGFEDVPLKVISKGTTKQMKFIVVNKFEEAVQIISTFKDCDYFKIAKLEFTLKIPAGIDYDVNELHPYLKYFINNQEYLMEFSKISSSGYSEAKYQINMDTFAKENLMKYSNWQFFIVEGEIETGNIVLYQKQLLFTDLHLPDEITTGTIELILHGVKCAPDSPIEAGFVTIFDDGEVIEKKYPIVLQDGTFVKYSSRRLSEELGTAVYKLKEPITIKDSYGKITFYIGDTDNKYEIGSVFFSNTIKDATFKIIKPNEMQLNNNKMTLVSKDFYIKNIKSFTVKNLNTNETQEFSSEKDFQIVNDTVLTFIHNTENDKYAIILIEDMNGKTKEFTVDALQWKGLDKIIYIKPIQDYIFYKPKSNANKGIFFKIGSDKDFNKIKISNEVAKCSLFEANDYTVYKVEEESKYKAIWCQYDFIGPTNIKVTYDNIKGSEIELKIAPFEFNEQCYLTGTTFNTPLKFKITTLRNDDSYTMNLGDTMCSSPEQSFSGTAKITTFEIGKIQQSSNYDIKIIAKNSQGNSVNYIFNSGINIAEELSIKLAEKTVEKDKEFNIIFNRKVTSQDIPKKIYLTKQAKDLNILSEDSSIYANPETLKISPEDGRNVTVKFIIPENTQGYYYLKFENNCGDKITYSTPIFVLYKGKNYLNNFEIIDGTYYNFIYQNPISGLSSLTFTKKEEDSSATPYSVNIPVDSGNVEKQKVKVSLANIKKSGIYEIISNYENNLNLPENVQLIYNQGKELKIKLTPGEYVSEINGTITLKTYSDNYNEEWLDVTFIEEVFNGLLDVKYQTLKKVDNDEQLISEKILSYKVDKKDKSIVHINTADIVYNYLYIYRFIFNDLSDSSEKTIGFDIKVVKGQEQITISKTVYYIPKSTSSETVTIYTRNIYSLYYKSSQMDQIKQLNEKNGNYEIPLSGGMDYYITLYYVNDKTEDGKVPEKKAYGQKIFVISDISTILGQKLEKCYISEMPLEFKKYLINGGYIQLSMDGQEMISKLNSYYYQPSSTVTEATLRIAKESEIYTERLQFTKLEGVENYAYVTKNQGKLNIKLSCELTNLFLVKGTTKIPLTCSVSKGICEFSFLDGNNKPYSYTNYELYHGSTNLEQIVTVMREFSEADLKIAFQRATDGKILVMLGSEEYNMNFIEEIQLKKDNSELIICRNKTKNTKCEYEFIESHVEFISFPMDIKEKEEYSINKIINKEGASRGYIGPTIKRINDITVTFDNKFIDLNSKKLVIKIHSEDKSTTKTTVSAKTDKGLIFNSAECEVEKECSLTLTSSLTENLLGESKITFTINSKDEQTETVYVRNGNIKITEGLIEGTSSSMILIMNTQLSDAYLTENALTISISDVECEIEFISDNLKEIKITSKGIIMEGVKIIVKLNGQSQSEYTVKYQGCADNKILTSGGCKTCKEIDSTMPVIYNKKCYKDCPISTYEYNSVCYDSCSKIEGLTYVENGQCVEGCSENYGVNGKYSNECSICREISLFLYEGLCKTQCPSGTIANNDKECLLPGEVENQEEIDANQQFCENGGYLDKNSDTIKCICLNNYIGATCSILKNNYQEATRELYNQIFGEKRDEEGTMVQTDFDLNSKTSAANLNDLINLHQNQDTTKVLNDNQLETIIDQAKKIKDKVEEKTQNGDELSETEVENINNMYAYAIANSEEKTKRLRRRLSQGSLRSLGIINLSEDVTAKLKEDYKFCQKAISKKKAKSLGKDTTQTTSDQYNYIKAEHYWNTPKSIEQIKKNKSEKKGLIYVLANECTDSDFMYTLIKTNFTGEEQTSFKDVTLYGKDGTDKMSSTCKKLIAYVIDELEESPLGKLDLDMETLVRNVISKFGFKITVKDFLAYVNLLKEKYSNKTDASYVEVEGGKNCKLQKFQYGGFSEYLCEKDGELGKPKKVKDVEVENKDITFIIPSNEQESNETESKIYLLFGGEESTRRLQENNPNNTYSLKNLIIYTNEDEVKISLEATGFISSISICGKELTKESSTSESQYYFWTGKVSEVKDCKYIAKINGEEKERDLAKEAYLILGDKFSSFYGVDMTSSGEEIQVKLSQKTIFGTNPEKITIKLSNGEEFNYNSTKEAFIIPMTEDIKENNITYQISSGSPISSENNISPAKRLNPELIIDPEPQIKKQTKEKKGLSGGKIAAIVLGCLAFVAVLVAFPFIFYFCYSSKYYPANREGEGCFTRFFNDKFGECMYKLELKKNKTFVITPQGEVRTSLGEKQSQTEIVNSGNAEGIPINERKPQIEMAKLENKKSTDGETN